MKGIILAGGHGLRLYPQTLAISKQIIPIFDKPMIYYPLSVLMMAGIRDILVISSPEHIDLYRRLFGDGSALGMRFDYAVQPAPEGVAQAFLIGESFIGNDPCALIFGDNFFYGSSLPELVERAAQHREGGLVFACYVKEPERYGVVEFDERQRAVNIEEKPRHPRSNYAVTGMYFYDNEVVSIAKTLRPSGRGELEITDVNNIYLRRGMLKVERFDEGIFWMDTGTPESLLEASNFVQAVEHRQGLKIGCVEEIAYRKGFIDRDQVLRIGNLVEDNPYCEYLRRLCGTDSPGGPAE
ncbi:MAG: glucose-1-phosphate thymidylyltransferase RfbA [Gemmatimonadetes bacterium]|nr:glucose-1-phosphate thymidylyltransferase RfbA [Gemmatimonadota bacterium]MYG84184.1 glucose-1-phosphate thymidylyltransferase RfbA [Gemmatimonadota bacterium]MYJ89799.1 glucose-1-phosphate thymidylyltransferase RfbA [Gemmatimonadota bacterium]